MSFNSALVKQVYWCFDKVKFTFKYLTLITINIFVLFILFLLFLTGVFIPKDIETIITGLTICLNPFNYFLSKFNGNYNFVSNFFDFGLKNSSLEKLGIHSDSTAANITPFIISIVVIWVLHLWIHIMLLIIFCLYCNSSSEVITKRKQMKLLNLCFIMHPLYSSQTDDSFNICIIYQSNLGM